jgi:signal transduction histidine kinase
MDAIVNILVVDDEPDNFDVIEILLAKEPYELGYVARGQDLCSRLEGALPDVILLDVMMPEIDGITLCRQIKARADWRHIPVVMVTALSSKADLARCLEAGADDFIAKPVNGTELKARIRSMLRIKQQHDALQSLLTLREDMANMMVHDLRNPLTSLMLSAERLQMSALDEAQQKKVAQIIRSTRQLRSLIDSLLFMAKLEAGQMLLRYCDIDLARLAQTVCQDFEAIAAQRQNQINCQLPTDDQRVWLDGNLMQRVLENLVANALKFSPRNSQITVTVSYPTAQEVRIQVADQGQGVKPELKDRIFQRFEIGEVVAGVSQVGLGLSFCKMAVEAHQGTIQVTDNQPHGAVFTVELPNRLSTHATDNRS